MKIVLVILCLSIGLIGVKGFGDDGDGNKTQDVNDPEIRKFRSGFGKETQAGSPECKEGTVCYDKMVNSARHPNDPEVRGQPFNTGDPRNTPAAPADTGTPGKGGAADGN